MWPYNDDEAHWLKPQERAAPALRGSANDNDPARRVPPRGAPAPVPTLPPKTWGES
jgi:hypothetical protein